MTISGEVVDTNWVTPALTTLLIGAWPLLLKLIALRTVNSNSLFLSVTSAISV